MSQALEKLMEVVNGRGLAIAGAFLTIFGVFQLVSGPYFDVQAKRSNFLGHVEKIQREGFSERASSINIMFTLVNADQLNGYSRDWRRFSEIWNRHEARLEGFHSDLADDATRGDALAGDERESIQMCREARNIIEAQEIIEQKLSQIRGINIIQGGGASMFGDALGPAVHVPDFANTRAIYSTCQKTTGTGLWGLIIAITLILVGIALAFWHFWKRRGQSVSS